MSIISSEDLSKLDEKEETKKDYEDGKVKKTDDSEVIDVFFILISVSFRKLVRLKTDNCFFFLCFCFKIIEIPDESEKSPDTEKKEVDSPAEKEDKNTGNGDGGKEKEVEDACKEKEEKDRTSESDKETPAEVKAEGSEGKNSEADVGKDEKMDTSSPTEEKKGTRCKTKHLFKLMLKYRYVELEF